MSQTASARPDSRSRLAVPLFLFSLAAVGAGAGRALTTTYLPVLLERIQDAPVLIGAVMTVNAIAGLRRAARRRPLVRPPRAPPALHGRRGAARGGGLVAVGLGNGTSYLALALPAGLVYTGLNALTTAHRALVAEDVEDRRRPAATSAQEIAGLAGAVRGGGDRRGADRARADGCIRAGRGGAGRQRASHAPPHAPAALGRARGTRAGAPGSARRVREVAAPPGGSRGAARPDPVGVRLCRPAGLLRALCRGDPRAWSSASPARFRWPSGHSPPRRWWLAGRARPERVHALLMTGAALLGGGLLAAAPATSLPAAAPGLALAALGAGLVTALGFPYFARFVPEGEAGGYSGVFFAGRAVAAAGRAAAGGPRGRAERQLPHILVVRRGGAGRARPACARRAPHRAGQSRGAPRARASVAAVIPVFASDRAVEVARAALEHVDEVVLVDDGAPPAIARSLDELAGDESRAAAAPGRKRREGQRRGRRCRGAARGPPPAGGDRGARLRRPARPAPHPGPRGGEWVGGRGDRQPPRSALDAGGAPTR